MTKRSIDRLVFAVITVPLICGIVMAYRYFENSEPVDTLRDSEFRCVLDIDIPDRSDMLLDGYNYLLLKSFADSLHSTALISCSYGSGSYIDSLKRGVVDILVLACDDTVSTDSVIYSHPIGGHTVWAVRSDRPGAVSEINAWTDAVAEDLKHLNQRSLFLHRYEPRKAARNGRKFKNISPYDELIKLYSKDLGWDWRLLAAVIFKESRFHIEALSGRGAKGLMQLMPNTAERYEVGNPIDPEESIRAGAGFLKRLQGRFSDKAADADELIRFTLAAYNAGEGRMMDCINYTSHIGGDSATWEGIVAAIPGMREESVLEVEAVKLGTFQGYETIAYVSRVLRIYEAFRSICPE